MALTSGSISKNKQIAYGVILAVLFLAAILAYTVL